jgi:uncharacterized membrane protein
MFGEWHMHAGGLARSGLDAMASQAGLDAAGAARLLELAQARPSAVEWDAAVRRFARLAGVLALGSGLVFFIAANWAALSPSGRLWLVQGVFATCIGLALWRPAPELLGRGALLLGFIAAGALFALFGQTFQTGADVHELFQVLAVLGLPLVFAARWSATSAAWLVVANVAIALYCGWVPGQHPLWQALGLLREDSAALRLSLGMWPNLVLWVLAELSAERSSAAQVAVPHWLRRLLLVLGLAYGCFAACWVVLDDESAAAFVLLPFLLACAAVVAWTLQRKRDPLPLFAVSAALVVLVSAVLIHAIRDEILLLILPAWLLLASGAAATVLLPLARRWEGERA